MGQDGEVKDLVSQFNEEDKDICWDMGICPFCMSTNINDERSVCRECKGRR